MKKIQNQKLDFKSTTTFNSTTGGAACASVCWGLAVGTRRGVVELYDLVDSAALFQSVSLYDWGYSMDDTGAVSCIACTLDNSAFAIGWKLRGLTVWPISGCRLMSTICQIGLSSASSPVVMANQDCKYEPMMGGISLMHWDEYGYRLHAAEERSSERSSEDTDKFKILHLHLPVSCLSQMAASKDGMYLAVAGLHGLILYELLFYPQYHLNQSSLLCRKPLFAKPVVMGVFQGYLLVTYRPFDVHIFHVKFSCELAPSSTPDLQFDPELEFDREVYPLGLLPNAGVVGGVSQRISFSARRDCGDRSPLQTRSRKLYFWHNYQPRRLIFPIAWSGFFLKYLMLKFPGNFILLTNLYHSEPCDFKGSCLHMINSCSMVNVFYEENVIHLGVIGMGGISYLAWGLGQSANKNQTSFPKHGCLRNASSRDGNGLARYIHTSRH
ncbi:hypothetical protein ACSBR2_016616 [Camellia fascicularis]